MADQEVSICNAAQLPRFLVLFILVFNCLLFLGFLPEMVNKDKDNCHLLV